MPIPVSHPLDYLVHTRNGDYTASADTVSLDAEFVILRRGGAVVLMLPVALVYRVEQVGAVTSG